MMPPFDAPKLDRLLNEAGVDLLLAVTKTLRGLTFDYALIASGLTFGRAPSNRSWYPGEVLSLDTAGYRNGYLADMARMAVMGPPTQLMSDLLAEVQFIQQAARMPVAAGRLGGEMYEAGRSAVAACDHRDGLVQ
jgi:Xaa-Pro dipeptidase